MAYAAPRAEFQTNAVPSRQIAAAAPRLHFLRRLFDALVESRQQRAQRDVSAFVARRGHRLTDSVEREINEHLFDGGWNARR